MPAPLTFGISLPNRAALFGTPVELLLETAITAEQTGYIDSIWVGDNYLSKPRLEAMVTLGALAGVTERVKLGTICLASFTLRDPLEVAIQWATLDQISGGRTILVVCIGGSASMGPQFAAELEAFGRKTDERIGRMIEGIELLRAFWGAEPVTYDGEYYQYREIDALPKPVQKHMPIAIAVNPPWEGAPKIEERALRRVARIADGWQTDGLPLDLFRSRWKRIQEYAAEYGRTGQVDHCSLHLMVNINDNEQQALRETQEFMLKYYGTGVVSDEKLASWLAYGSPQRVIEMLDSYIDAGCTTPVLRFTSLDQLGQLKRCAAEVLPAFGDQLRSAD